MEQTTVGPYRIERQLSRSGLSRVYGATDMRNGRLVALKIAALPGDAAGRASFAALFRTETDVLASLKHPAVTAILDTGTTEEGSPYFVMEYVHGRDLGKVLDEQGRLPVDAALKIARQVAGGLGAAHAKGYLHRDVKPENILVVAGVGVSPWTIKLLDFGVTERVDDRTQMTRGGDYFGSLRYMSPEQVRAQPLSARSDVWGLGVTLYEMLVGSPAFSGEGMAATMAAIMSAEVKVPLDREVPEAAMAFVQRCLSRDPAMRPADGMEAKREIARLESLLGFPEVVGVMPAPTPAVGSAPAAMDARSATVRVPGSRSRPVWVVIAVIALGVTFAVLFAISLSRKAAPMPGHTPGTTHFPTSSSSEALSGVMMGVILTLGGLLIGRGVRRLLAGKTGSISERATEVLSGARSRDELSRTMAIQVDDIAAQCRLADERFLATTMAVMVDEYGASTTFDDRQKALMNAVALLEKLNAKLSPWWVRHDKLIALGVTLVGVVSGLVTIVQNVAKLIKGS